MNNFDYKNMTPFKWFVLENFPFIENAFEAIDNYRLFSKVVEYLNKTIDNMNLTGEQMENVTNAMTELQNYVNNYFDNLDVQDEINNKLDEMVESGQFNQIIRTYVDPYFVKFNTAIKEQNETITELNNKITNATNMNPLVASSTSDMTDTTRIYVNTTDGKWYYYDGDSWEIGGDYQTAVDSNAVDMLKYEMSLYTKGIVPLYNRMNNASYNTGHIYANVNGNVQVRTANGYGTIDPFPVKSGVTYTMYNSSGGESGNMAKSFSFIADENGHILETNIAQVNIRKLTPSKDGYLYVTCVEQTQYDYSNYMICVDGTQPTSYKNYNVPYDYKILETSYNDLVEYYSTASQQDVVTYHTINVGSTRYYTSISSAIATIEDSSSLNRYNILIDDGTYNETNINLPNYVNLVGASGIRENCVINGELSADSTDETMTATSTLNMNYNNEIKNITIIGKNLRYPVHDETNGQFKNWKQVVENCVIEHKGNQEVVQYRIDNNLPAGNPWSSPHAWGMGASSGCELKIKNSKFISPEWPFYTHGASNFEKPYLIEIEDSQMISTNLLASVYIDNTTPTIDGNTVLIKNSFLNSRYQVITNKEVNCIISGSDVVPVYQRPTTVLSKLGYPIFTNNTKMLVASENLEQGTFVKSVDGVHAIKADNTTPLKDLLGYVVGDTSSGDMAMIVSKYMQPTQQTWPETSITSGDPLYLDSNGKITTTTGTIKVGITQDRWYKLFI